MKSLYQIKLREKTSIPQTINDSGIRGSGAVAELSWRKSMYIQTDPPSFFFIAIIELDLCEGSMILADKRISSASFMG